MNACSRRLRAFAVLFLAAHVGCTADVPNPPAAVGLLLDVDASESYVASVHEGSLIVTPLAGGDPIIVRANDGRGIEFERTAYMLESGTRAFGWFVGRSNVLLYTHAANDTTLELWKPGLDRGVAIGFGSPVFATSDGAYLAFSSGGGAIPNGVVRTADCTSAGCAVYSLGKSGHAFFMSLANGGRLLYGDDGEVAAYVHDVDSGVTTRVLDDASRGAVLSPDGSKLIWIDPSTQALYAKDLDSGAVEPWAGPTMPWTNAAVAVDPFAGPTTPWTNGAAAARAQTYSDHVFVDDSPDANTLVEYVCSRVSCTEISRSCLGSPCAPSADNRYCTASIDANGAASSLACLGLSPLGGSIAVLDPDGNPDFEWSSSNEVFELTVSDDGSRYVGERRSNGSANVDVITGAMPPSNLDTSTMVGRYALPGAAVSGIDWVSMASFSFVPGSSQFVFSFPHGSAEGYWWTGTSLQPLGLLAYSYDLGPRVLARVGHVYWSAPDGVRRLPVQ